METKKFDIIFPDDFEVLKEFEQIELKGGIDEAVRESSDGICNVDNFNGNCVSGCGCSSVNSDIN
jgi:hypothetical protein